MKTIESSLAKDIAAALEIGKAMHEAWRDEYRWLEIKIDSYFRLADNTGEPDEEWYFVRLRTAKPNNLLESKEFGEAEKAMLAHHAELPERELEQ